MNDDLIFHEYERRFLVREPAQVIGGHRGNLIVQGYLFSRNGYVVRVRRTHYPNDDGSYREGPAILAVKGPRRSGARQEYEMQVPMSLAIELIKQAGHKVSKTRFQIVAEGHVWDVDVFHGDNEGLAIAECESEKIGRLNVPAWCGAEVTNDARYNNENLAAAPYRTWTA